MLAAPTRKTQARSPEVNAHLYAARDARREKRWADAVASYEKAIKLAPEDSRLLDNTAWFLLTVEDEASRNPKRAVELATRAVELTDEESGQYLGTLAEAQYQAGDLEGATKSAGAAAKLDPHPERRDRAERYRKELEKKLDDKLVEERNSAGAAATRRKSAIPEWPPRDAKANRNVPVAADSADPSVPTDADGAPGHVPETDDTDAASPPWIPLGLGLVGLACAAGMMLAFRRALRALR